ncbi:MAG: hypothetical protein Q9159_005786 [Coniocarpon cinnabarinum]
MQALHTSRVLHDSRSSNAQDPDQPSADAEQKYTRNVESNFSKLQEEADRFSKEWQPEPIDHDGVKGAITSTSAQHDPNVSGQTLPSNRVPLADRIHHLSNQIISSMTRIAHTLNMYTGTDYTPIQSIRDRIQHQEHALRDRHEDVAATKIAHEDALNKQRLHQKEVVQLLERKHSWTDGDMERYMGLIRSEHSNERGVENAAREVTQAERSLEEARQGLERNERKMYHEEQIWSDTIRRNSTWITFGLMGVNMFLLLTQVVLLEPWRRKRLIKEMRTALDEKAVAATAAQEVEKPLETKSPEMPVLEAGKTTPAVVGPLEEMANADAATLSQTQTHQSLIPADEELDQLPSATLPDMAFEHLPPHPFTSSEAFMSLTSWRGMLERWRLLLQDLFSSRIITLRRVDLTTDRLGSAILGLAFGIVLGLVSLDYDSD